MSASNIFCFIRSGEYGETSIRTVTTHTHYGMFICLAREYFSTRYGQLITACSSFVQCLSTLVPQYSVQTLTSACLLLSTLVPQYSVRTTHHGLFISQYVSTVVLGTDNSSRLVYFLVRQYCSTRYGQLITACLFAQYVSTVVLGTDNSSRLVLQLFSALVHQYLSTRYRHSPQHVYLLSTLVLQYSIRTTHHGSFFISLVPCYVSTSVLDTDNSSWLVYFLSTLVPQYSVRTTHHGVFYICSVPQYVSTLVLGRDTSLRLVLHFFSALVRYYLSTRNRHSPRLFICLVRYTGKNI